MEIGLKVDFLWYPIGTEGGCQEFCVNDFCLKCWHPIFEENEKAIKGCFPIFDRPGPFLGNIIQG